MIKISNIKLSIYADEAVLREKVFKLLKLTKFYGSDESAKLPIRILKKSLDARSKPELFYVYSVAVECDKKIEDRVLGYTKLKNVSKYNEEKYNPIIDNEINIDNKRFEDADRESDVVVVGAGPAGLFCAYILALNGCKPLIIERGEDVRKRSETVERFFKEGILNTESNVQFGEGGAGTFSDGKLNTMVKDKSGRNQFVLDTFVSFGAKESIAYDAKPHVGTDELKKIVTNLRYE